MSLIYDSAGNAITVFPRIGSNRVMPVGFIGEDGDAFSGSRGHGYDYANNVWKPIAVTPDGSQKSSISASDSLSIDAFGRWRTADPKTLFDSKQIFDNLPLLWDDSEVSGSGTTSTYSSAQARTRIAVSNTTAGRRVRQTFMRFNYQPGKSQLILLTAKMNAEGAGIKASVGYYDDDNGLFFTSDDGVLKVVTRTSTSGSVVDNEVEQANWNLDRMDGTGESGITLDPTKTQIMFIDFEWLGVGRVRMGFVIDGLIIYCHEFLNTNNLDVVYMSTPNLPLRYEIENDGTGAATSMDHICSSVVSEGGSEDLGIVRYASTAGTHVVASTENIIYAIIGIRLKSAQISESVKILNSALQIQTGTDQVEWVLKLNPTVAGTFTYSDQTNSAVQIATGATANTVTGGTDITGGFLESGGVQAGNAGSGGSGINNAILLGSAIDGTLDQIVLCARPIGGSSSVNIEGSMSWRELT